MHRNSLLNQLYKYNPKDKEEIGYKERMIQFVKKYPNCFKRELEIGHITASAWLLNKEQTHVLLTHHAKLDIWIQVGGHCDGNSNVIEVAIKEAQEESGVQQIAPLSTEIFDIDIHLIPKYKHIKAHYHYDIRFLLTVNSNESIVVSEESKNLQWFTKDKQILPTQDRSVIRMFDKWVNNLNLQVLIKLRQNTPKQGPVNSR